MKGTLKEFQQQQMSNDRRKQTVVGSSGSERSSLAGCGERQDPPRYVGRASVAELVVSLVSPVRQVEQMTL